ncbi:hypothetical protein CTJ15_03875 (plasmid) [Roseomonas sp. FDAARGOS_362]|nr:hypothetical protein CTJ15_03875 [Roseomonas sp. FDAARGOS_362]
MALTDEQWAVLEPLVEACRPHAKVPSLDGSLHSPSPFASRRLQIVVRFLVEPALWHLVAITKLICRPGLG